MAGDKRISVADAADYLETEDAEEIIDLAWRRETIRLHGVPPGETEPVEIPANEGGRIDCVGSRVVLGRLLTLYESVTIKWDDTKRLADDAERLAQEQETGEAAASAAPPPEQAPQHASDADILEAEAGPIVKEVALELRRIFPKGRPALRSDELMERVKKASGEKLGVFSLRTLERAIALAWPRAKRQRGPKAGKARQT